MMVQQVRPARQEGQVRQAQRVVLDLQAQLEQLQPFPAPREQQAQQVQRDQQALAALQVLLAGLGFKERPDQEAQQDQRERLVLRARVEQPELQVRREQRAQEA